VSLGSTGRAGRASVRARVDRPTPGPDPLVSRARWVLMGLYVLWGLTGSSWLARLPAIRDTLHLTTGQLGSVLIAGSVGSLFAVTVAGALVARLGGRTVLGLSAVGIALANLLDGVGPSVGSVAVLAVGVLLGGVSFALANVPLNVETAAVERRMGRTVLPQFHAGFSLGAVVGSGIGALASHAGVSLLVQFGVTAVVGLTWRLASIPHVVLETGAGWWPSGPASPDGVVRASAPRRLTSALGAWRERRTLLIGVVIMSAAFSEGAANNWLGLAVVDGFGRTEATGALVLAVFIAAMTLVRLFGTHLIDRYGRVVVLRTSGLVSLGGLLLFGLAPSLPVAGFGVLAWGLGAALAVPIGISAASDDPMRAAARVSVVSAFSSAASLAAPPLLGFAAQSIGIRHTLLIITVAMVASVLNSRSVARPAKSAPEPVSAVPQLAVTGAGAP
jgi:MFS family permease